MRSVKRGVMKKVKIFGRSIPVLAIVAIVASAGMVSAALLSYYGKITMTADVKQSVLVDGKDYTEPIIDTLPVDVPGGETFCFTHTLTNRASVPATVKLETSYDPDGVGIKTTYYKMLGLSETISPEGSITAEITVEDLGDRVRWIVDMDEATGPFSNGHAAVMLTIGVGDEPKYTIHSNDGICAEYSWGTWLYTAYDGGWNPFEADRNTEVSEIDWVSASGARDLSTNTGAVFTITIDKEKLDMEEFRWGMKLMGDTSDTDTPNGFDWADTSTFNTAIVGEEIISGITIGAGETLDFSICYSFAMHITPEIYTITTTVEPA